MLTETFSPNHEKSQNTILKIVKPAVAFYPLPVKVLKRSSTKSKIFDKVAGIEKQLCIYNWGNLLPKFETPVNQTPSRQLFAACKNSSRARASRSRCPLHRKRESRHQVSGCKIARIRLHDAHIRSISRWRMVAILDPIRFLFSFIFRLGVWLCQESATRALHAYSLVERGGSRGAGRHWPQVVRLRYVG